MIARQVTTPTSALPARPERPLHYVCPVTAPDGSVCYDHPLENYFDASMAPRLLPSHNTTRLYDTVARAHDHRFQLTPDMIDPSWSTPRPLFLNHRERYRSVANLRGDAPDYMGISPDFPEWRPRRSSYEDRRGVVGVTPSEVNTLVPYIPPIDTSMPPPSKEWLDAMAKRILADAHADFEDSHPSTSSEPQSQSSLTAEDSFSFDYDTDSTLDGPVYVPPISLPQPLPQVPQADSESNSTTDAWDADMDTDTDTDTDTSDDEGCNWDSPPISDSKWLIRRKRPSVIMIDNDPPARPPKRQNEGESAPYNTRSPKRYANYTPEHPLGCPPVSSITATAQRLKHVRIASPCASTTTASSQVSKSPRLFPCGLDGCARVCSSAGDLHRHQQSLRHRQPSHSCLACGKSYTRSDALKRHLNSKAACKKVHTRKLSNDADLEQLSAEANTEAV